MFSISVYVANELNFTKRHWTKLIEVLTLMLLYYEEPVRDIIVKVDSRTNKAAIADDNVKHSIA